MIVDLDRFVAEESPYWHALEDLLARFERDPAHAMDLAEATRFHYLYERACADLGKVSSFAAEPQLHRFLESLVARAYGEIYEIREASHRFRPIHWFLAAFPCSVRRHSRVFLLSVLLTLAGTLFGALAVLLDAEARDVLIPFPQLQIDPRTRVQIEESEKDADRLAGKKWQGAAFYMTHNTKVSLLTLAFGMSYGTGTIAMLFGNGVMLGCVAADYVQAGEAKFLVGWLLPHGAVEIPAILLAGQAGLILGSALIGWRKRLGVKDRFRAVLPDIMNISGGMAVFLVWAGIIEAFFSQYHEPQVSYEAKIAFGCVELLLVGWLLARSGRRAEAPRHA